MATLRLQMIRKMHERFRTLFHRVAKKAHVDASYVSRVVSGERHSETIEKHLKEEINKIMNRRTCLFIIGLLATAAAKA